MVGMRILDGLLVCERICRWRLIRRLMIVEVRCKGSEQVKVSKVFKYSRKL